MSTETTETPSGVRTQSRPRLVAAVRVYNEADFLQRWLDGMAKIADDIVAIDDGSADGSSEILKAHPAVSELHVKKRGKHTDTKDHRRMTQMALDHGAEWISFLDADEMWDARVVDALPKLLSDESVGEYKFRKPWLWRTEDQLRADHPDKYFAWCLPRLVRASPDLKWEYPEGTLRRTAEVLLGRARFGTNLAYGELSGIPGRVVQVPPEELVLLHYAASRDYGRMQWKHIRYAISWAREYPKRDPDEIADHFAKWIDEGIVETRPLPAEWRHFL
jgi:glycosyltransferase involved in cell wall biosynthesis